MLTKIFAKIERFIPKKWRWVLAHNGFKRYFLNTGWMFFGQMFNLGLSFFIGIWAAMPPIAWTPRRWQVRISSLEYDRKK